MHCVWLYLSIWNTLHQSRYTVLWQRRQCGPRSGSLHLCSKKTVDVTPSVKQRPEACLRSVRGSTLQVCTLSTVLLGRGNTVINRRAHREPPRPTDELTSPHLHSHMHGLSPAMTQSLESERQRETGSRFIRIKPHLQSHRLPTPSVITGETDYDKTTYPPPPPLHIYSSEGEHTNTRTHTHRVRRNRM